MTDSPDGPGGEEVRTSVVVTDRPDVVSELVRQIYSRTRLSLDAPAADFRFRVASAEAGELTCGVQQWGFSGRARSDPMSRFTTVLVADGSMRQQRRGRPDVLVGPGDVWRSDTAVGFDSAWSQHSTFVTLSLPLASLAEAAAARSDAPFAASDHAPAVGVRFLENAPVDETAARYWALLMRLAYREATAPQSALASPLIRSHLVRTLTGAALAVFPNSIMTSPYERGSGQVGPATLRRAVAHLHAHAAEPLTLTEIAAAAGISPRALQAAFVRHHGCTPMSYLRTIRLEHAHRELQAADQASGDTVTGIAQRWGFGNPGRFGVAYLRAYGRRPSETLRG